MILIDFCKFLFLASFIHSVNTQNFYQMPQMADSRMDKNLDHYNFLPGRIHANPLAYVDAPVTRPTRESIIDALNLRSYLGITDRQRLNSDKTFAMIDVQNNLGRTASDRHSTGELKLDTRGLEGRVIDWKTTLRRTTTMRPVHNQIPRPSIA